MHPCTGRVHSIPALVSPTACLRPHPPPHHRPTAFPFGFPSWLAGWPRSNYPSGAACAHAAGAQSHPVGLGVHVRACVRTRAQLQAWRTCRPGGRRHSWPCPGVKPAGVVVDVPVALYLTAEAGIALRHRAWRGRGPWALVHGHGQCGERASCCTRGRRRPGAAPVLSNGATTPGWGESTDGPSAGWVCQMLRQRWREHGHGGLGALGGRAARGDTA